MAAGCCGKRRAVCLLVLGCIFLVLAVGLPFAVDFLQQRGVTQQVVVDSSSSSRYDDWQDDENGRFTYTLFNITNPYGMIDGGEPARFNTVGPLTYRLRQLRYNVAFDNDAGTVGYNQWLFYEFDQGLSGGRSDAEFVTLVNPTFQGVVAQAMINGRSSNPQYGMLQLILAVCYSYFPEHTDFLNATVPVFTEGANSPDGLTLGDDTGVFVSRPAKDWLWGYESMLLGRVRDRIMGPTYPSAFPGLQVNFTHRENATDLGRYELRTGHKHRSDVQEYVEWRNMTDDLRVCLIQPCEKEAYEPAWNSSEANTVMGTTGQQFPPGVTSDDKFTIWQFPLTRHAPIEYSGEDVTLKDITLKRFIYPQSMWEDAGTNPANAPYYQNGPSCTLNLSSVQFGAPIFATQAAFTGCDLHDDHFAASPSDDGVTFKDLCLGDGGDGIFECEAYFDIEPTTGLTMHTHSPTQANVMFARPPGTSADSVYNSVPLGANNSWWPNLNTTRLVPLFIGDPNGEVSDSDADEFKSQMSMASTTRKVAVYAGYPLAAVCLIAGAVGLWSHRKQQRFERQEMHGESGDIASPLIDPEGGLEGLEGTDRRPSADMNTHGTAINYEPR